MVLAISSCYDDLGNYTYKDINEIKVEGIEELYNVDVDDQLTIIPKIEGTMYSDTSRFSYQWEIQDEIVAETHDLDIVINMIPGNKISRYIITDKETGIKKYHKFTVNVSSSTAGDLIVVLSKYKGTSELSYLRLDKASNWAVNYVKDRCEEPLGKNPKQLSIFYTESARSYPFTNRYGRLNILADNQVYLFDKSTMMPDTLTTLLLADAFTGLASYPKPDTEGYKPEFMTEAISLWRKSAYGNYFQANNYIMMISGGALYTGSIAPSIWSPSYTYNNKSPYIDGYFSDFAFYDEMAPTPNDRSIQLGYTTGDIILFDKNNGRFAYANPYGGVKSIEEKYIKKFTDYNLLWGSPTTIANQGCVSILNDGDKCKLLLINTGYEDDSDKYTTKKLVAEVSCGNVINSSSKFYMMKYNTYLFFVTDNKLYKYNLLDASSGIAPSDKNLVMTLSDYGYGSDASIKDICVSRSEKTMMLAISRYGSDTEGEGDEAKGDILSFDLNAATLEISHNEARSYKGISGLPVDLEIKYQTHWRDGLYLDGTMKDNI